MFKIKQTPGDFIVNEFAEHSFKQNGAFAVFSLQKFNLSTPMAIKRVAKRLNILDKNIGFAGMKDKIALTFQFISIKNGNKDMTFEEDDLSLTFQGFLDDAIRIGNLKGNQFAITVESDSKPIHVDFTPNYFGEQRFSKNNAEIGKALIDRNFKLAIELIDDSQFQEKAVIHLKKHSNDFVGTLNLLPKKHVLMYVHAFQSLIYNKLLDEYIRDTITDFEIKEISGQQLAFPKVKIQNKKIPLIGFGSKPIAGVEPRSFLIREIPWLSVEGSERNAFVPISNLRITQTSDIQYFAEFFLPKGCYATTALRSLF